MKVFISQPMNGKTDEEIKAERSRMINVVKTHQKSIAKRLDSKKVDVSKVEFIDSYFDDLSSVVSEAPDDARIDIYMLGKSIEMLASADVAVFGKGFEKARGCQIEKRVCEEYGIPTI